jgi:hypothetical protein
MDQVEIGGTKQIRCDGCGELTPSYNIVTYGSAEHGQRRQLCSQCFNKEVAKRDGLNKFEDAKFEPVGLVDCTGDAHEFHFRTYLFGPGVALDAFELRDGHPSGYQFKLIGDPEDDLLVLLGRLIEKMRRALSIKHLRDDKLELQIAEHAVVRGIIQWDTNHDGHVPVLVVDGREITWEEFGRMLMSFEGFQFKLEVRDMSGEL